MHMHNCMNILTNRVRALKSTGHVHYTMSCAPKDIKYNIYTCTTDNIQTLHQNGRVK